MEGNLKYFSNHYNNTHEQSARGRVGFHSTTIKHMQGTRGRRLRRKDKSRKSIKLGIDMMRNTWDKNEQKWKKSTPSTGFEREGRSDFGGDNRSKIPRGGFSKNGCNHGKYELIQKSENEKRRDEETALMNLLKTSTLLLVVVSWVSV